MKIIEKQNTSKKDEIIRAIISNIGSIIVSVFALAASIILILSIFNTDTSIKTRNGKTFNHISSLKGSTEKGGIFYLGFGTISNTDYYIFLKEDHKFNGYTKEKVPTAQTIIIEKDTIPNIQMNFQIEERSIKRTMFGNDETIIDSNEYGTLNRIPKHIKYKYIITVPIGTITQNETFEPLK